MGRKPRVEYYGAIYHVIHKGKNREPIFRYEDDKSYILELINESKEKYDFKVFAYAILDDHYHLLIQTLNIPISKIMYCINYGYAKYYNSKFHRTGPVFRDRYKGIIVRDERLIPDLVKYIHYDPVLHNICNSIVEYKWSSDVFYRVNMEGVVDIEELLNHFSKDRNEAIEKYIEFMDKEGFEFEEKIFIRESERLNTYINIQPNKDAILDEILINLCPSEKEYRLIKEGSRNRYLTQYKVKYIHMGREKGYTFNELGQNIGITGAAARTLVNEWFTTNV